VTSTRGPTTVRDLPYRKIAVAVGLLFIFQMAAAVAGTSMIQEFTDGARAQPPTTGVLLMMCSGVAVVGIGLLMYRVLAPVDQMLALWYPILRIVEFTISVACGIYLLTNLREFPNQLLWVYIPTGIGGLILNYLLLAARLVPSPIAVLGLVGYGLLSLGVALDFLGLLDMNAGTGQLLLVPGGLYEFLILPAWLIAKGFRRPSAAPELTPPSLAPTS
jgi:uncharacterized protein DUF4386